MTATPPSIEAQSSRRTLFAGSGEMRQRVREFDWVATPLGPISCWSQSLCTATDLVLGSAFPNILLWGRELVQLYNDAYVPIIGGKHSAALGHGNEEI